ncbi:MAG: TolC family protein, partial [Planctomycetota bacterium]
MMMRLRLSALLWATAGTLLGCAASQRVAPRPEPPPTYADDHRFTLDELIELALYHNAGIDVARYEAEAARGLVDQVKALWLPQVRLEFAGMALDNDFNYEANVFNLLSLDVPVTGNYNFISAAALSQILATGGKRTSGLKQAKMFAAIKKLQVLVQRDAVAYDVANLYYLVCLTNELDGVLEDAVRRVRVFRQVAQGLNERGSMRSNKLDALLADYFVAQLDQLRILLQAGRHQAYKALRHYVGWPTDRPLVLKDATLPPVVKLGDVFSRTARIVQGWFERPELKQLDLFTEIRKEQVKFAKAAWAPNIVLLGTYSDVQGNNNSVLGAVDGLLVTLLVDIPIYDPARRGKLREALGLEQASLAFQRQIEELITLEMEVTAVDFQKALASLVKAARAAQIAHEYYMTARQSYSRELVPGGS